jgi:hypothetical protein
MSKRAVDAPDRGKRPEQIRASDQGKLGESGQNWDSAQGRTA